MTHRSGARQLPAGSLVRNGGLSSNRQQAVTYCVRRLQAPWRRLGVRLSMQQPAVQPWPGTITCDPLAIGASQQP